MASSAPNPYGQAPATGGHIHYSDYNQSLAQQQQQQQQQQSQQQTSATVPLARDLSPTTYESTPGQQQRMNVIGGEKPLLHHSSSSLVNYDSYISGMSSDSELNSSSTTTRHHHHRPYSSQSRVYHAHPVPRNSLASSRLSHYSSNSAANVHNVPPPSHSSNSYAIQQQHQQQQQQNLQQQFPQHQSLSTTPPSKPISSLSHQSSIASSGGSMSSGSYLPPIMPHESPLSPVIMRQQQQQQKQQTLRQGTPSGGRQLPQRPFTHSMSIDQHSQLANHYQPTTSQMPTHSPAHESAAGASLHRNLTGDHLVGYQQKSYPGINQRYEPPNSHYHETLSQRNLRLEMERVEMQAAAMNLYDSGEAGSLADLPPSGSARPGSSSSSGRHLPNIVGSPLSLQQQQQQHQTSVDPFNQSPRDDLQYAGYSQHHRKIPLASSTDWQPSSNQTTAIGRPVSSQFKQTMSIDHYPASRQQQRHLTQAGIKQGQFASSEQYHSLGQPYPGASTNQHTPIGSGYVMDSTDQMATNQTLSSGSHTTSSAHQEHPNLKYHHYPSQQQLSSTNYQASSSLQDPHNKPLDANVQHSGVQQQHQQHFAGRPKLQHQQSSSSSNSNLSSSLKTSNIDNQQQANPEKQPMTSAGEHHPKSASSASAGSAHYQQSPQHKLPPPSSGHYSRQELLRRGHTSIAASIGGGHGGSGSGSGGSAGAAGYGADFGGSQSALSESGDLSGMQTSSSSHTGRRLRAASPSGALEASTSSGPHHGGYHHHYHHSTSSGAGIRDGGGMRSESTTGLPNGAGGSSTLTKKSNSATQLSMTGTKKRLGFRKKQVTSFSVHRSEEVAPLEARHLVKQGSSVSEGDSSMSGDSSSRSWSNSKQTPEELASMSFIDGLGKGQMISRQGLASPYLGDIQLSLCDRRGNLEIEIIRARNLQAKTNKILPLTYVKLYLVKNRKCLAKAKTTLSNKRTLNPLFQQQLTFHEDYRGCILQSIVWGNFGKMDKKNFMGIAQISIDDLELSDTVISWYKLFLPSSLQTLPSKSLRHTLLSNSTESFTTTNNS